MSFKGNFDLILYVYTPLDPRKQPAHHFDVNSLYNNYLYLVCLSGNINYVKKFLYKTTETSIANNYTVVLLHWATS